MTPEEQRLENQKKNAELVHAYKRFAMTDDGEIIMADLMNFCGRDKTSVSATSQGLPIDPYQTHVNEGKRRVWLRIDSYVNRKENKDERKPNSTVGGIGN